MEQKKKGIGSVASSAGKAAADLFGKAKKTMVKAVDQNDDGEFNLQDVAAVADNVGSAAKKAAGAVKGAVDQLGDRSREKERKALHPIFADELDSPDFSISKLIRVTEKDKKHADSELCEGSIGHIEHHKDLDVVNVYWDQIDAFGLSFYPDRDQEIYYVDPCDRDQYIALDEYFNYLKIQRVSELQLIARDLGARYFKVTYKEHKKHFHKIRRI